MYRHPTKLIVNKTEVNSGIDLASVPGCATKHTEVLHSNVTHNYEMIFDISLISR